MKTKDITIMALLIALSCILANFKFLGSIALDSCPAMLAVFLYKDYKGAVIAMIGHIVSAGLAGFPYGLPSHIMIMIGMGVMMILSSMLYKKTNNLIITIIFMFIFNTFISSTFIWVITGVNIPAYVALLPILGQATIANLVIAALVYKPIKKAVYGNA